MTRLRLRPSVLASTRPWGLSTATSRSTGNPAMLCASTQSSRTSPLKAPVDTSSASADSASAAVSMLRVAWSSSTRAASWA